jgi:hypothetical protein
MPKLMGTEQDKVTAISYAAYRCLMNLYSSLPQTTRDAINALFVEFGGDPTNNNTTPTTPAGVGNNAR